MATQPIEAATPLYAILATIPALPRPILSALATRIIERMDEIDGDPDLEEDDDDHGVDDVGEEDHRHMLDLPAYGIDQSRGPLNEVVAIRDWQRRHTA